MISAPPVGPSLRVALVIVLGITLGGCAAAEVSPSTSIPAETRTPDVENIMPADAHEVYGSYIDASNAVDLGDPETFGLPGEFTSDRFHADELAALWEMHDAGDVAGGAIRVRSFTLQTPIDAQTIVAVACNDVSSVTLVDRRGVSLLPLDAPDTYRMRLEFERSGDEIRLASSVASEGSRSCAQ